MNSNTHIAWRPAVWNRSDASPWSSITIISPGCTSRTKVAFTVSRAQVSDATTCAGWPFGGAMKPRQSGLNP